LGLARLKGGGGGRNIHRTSLAPARPDREQRADLS
jgi:hypothetical protein